MKKLLLSALACLCALGATAQSAGDYVYSGPSRFKISTGTNLVTNGDFSKGTAGWTTAGGRDINPDSMQTVDDGPDGSQCLYVAMKDNGPGTGSSLMQAVSVRAGQYYYISYMVKADESVTTNTVSGSNVKNYQNVFFNTDGSTTVTTPIAKSQSYSTQWDTITYSVQAPDNGYVVFYFYGPLVGTRFDNFKVLEVQEVADDRVVNLMIGRLQAYIDNPLFADGKEQLADVISQLKEELATEDKTTMDEMLKAVEAEVIPDFLDRNTVNVSGYLKYPDFDELPTTSVIKSGTSTTWGKAWTVTNTRWQVAGPDKAFETNHIMRSLPGGFTLEEGKIYQTTTLLPAGKYMFSMKANALRYKDKNNNVMDNYDIRGMKIFINGDSAECFPVDTARVTTYEVYSDVTEGHPVTVGFYMPDGVANVVSLDFTELRAIGLTQEAVEAYADAQRLADAKANLENVVDSATAYTQSTAYIYDKDVLAAAISTATMAYATETTPDGIAAAADSLCSDIRNFLKHNSIYRELMDAIADAEEKLAGKGCSNGRDDLQAAINVAKDYAASLAATSDSEDRAKADAATIEQTSALGRAVNTFIFANTGSGQDEVFPFSQWASVAEPVYPSLLSVDGVTTSDGTEMHPETATFEGNDLKGRFAFPLANVNRAATEKGLEVTAIKKNMAAVAILNLKAGDQVTLDWAVANTKHAVYVSSGNASYVNADGETINMTLVGSKAKVSACQLKAENYNGVNGMTRTTFTMTADGTLDFFFGSASSTLRIGYAGIKYVDATGIDELKAQKPGAKNGVQGVYSISGQKVGDNAASISSLAKGVYVCNGRKFIVK